MQHNALSEHFLSPVADQYTKYWESKIQASRMWSVPTVPHACFDGIRGCLHENLMCRNLFWWTVPRSKVFLGKITSKRCVKTPKNIKCNIMIAQHYKWLLRQPLTFLLRL